MTVEKRFLISPDKKIARWAHPVEVESFYQGWYDHTDTTREELIEFLQKDLSNPVDSTSEQP